MNLFFSSSKVKEEAKVSWLLLLLSAFLFHQAAHAENDGGLFIEPGLAHEQSRLGFQSENNIVNFGGDLRGQALTLKFGGHAADIVTLGLDAMYSQPRFQSDNYSSEARSLLGGVFAGLQTPYAGIRLWGTYYPYGYLDQNRDRGLQMKFSEPDIYKVGAGLRVAAFSVNFEYLKGNYKKSEVQNDQSTFANFREANASREEWSVGLSFPMSL